jgi:glycerate 2-kinase
MSAEKSFREYAASVFTQSLEHIRPQTMVEKSVRIEGETLIAGAATINLDSVNNIYVAAMGKAAQLMTEGLDSAIGKHITRGVLLSNAFFGDLDEKYQRHICTHPLPTQQNVLGADALIEMVENADENDLVISLISGGGSSIFTRPEDGLSVADLAATADLLMKAGAPIHELNAARKHLSKVKGGKFLKLVSPAKSVALCLSDVPGDDISVIASGPTSADDTTFNDVQKIFEKYDLRDQLPDAVIDCVMAGCRGERVETLKTVEMDAYASHTEVIGCNHDMLLSMAKILKQDGYTVTIDENHFEGIAREFAGSLVEVALKIRQEARLSGRPQAFLQGGETTVKVSGSGLGGRNSEVALAAAIALEGHDACLLLSAGTDGKDGPTDAAGAIADGSTIRRSMERGLDAKSALENNDSYNLFAPLGDVLKTGPTGTNLMDVVMILAK